MKTVWLPVCRKCEESDVLELAEGRRIVCRNCGAKFGLEQVEELYQELEDIDGVFFPVGESEEENEFDEEGDEEA